jgi:MFS family permease
MNSPPTASTPTTAPRPSRHRGWINRTIIGIAAATLFSDFSHETVTAVLPLYLASVGLGAAALGVIEGVADFLVSLSKLGGGYAGHRLRRKQPVAAGAYLVTALATSAIGLVTAVPLVLAMRSIAWIARGFRGPLRDYLLGEAVQKTHYGRAYGLERAADMIGAVAGPLTATLLVFLGLQFRFVILWALIPGVLAACSMFFLAREPTADPPAFPAAGQTVPHVSPRFPRLYWLFLAGILLFGLGDFSRTFLILIASSALKEHATSAPMPGGGAVSIAVLLYAGHNLISALAAFPAGSLGDRFAKRSILTGGYALGVATNLVLAFAGNSLPIIIAAVAMSGVYIAVEETNEKAAVAELLPRELKSLGFGLLACANAVGDMASSLYVGALMGAGRGQLAFLIAAGLGATGVLWMLLIVRGARTPQSVASKA